MAAVLHTFAELAAALAPVLGVVKATKMMGETPFLAVAEKCGRNAAIVWALINDLEATKKSGPNGSILFDVDFIRVKCRLSGDEAATAAFQLIRHGFAKPCMNGRAIKAA